MAGADTACVPARAGTILGVTRSAPPRLRLEAGRALASSLGSDAPRPLPRHARRLRLFPDPATAARTRSPARPSTTSTSSRRSRRWRSAVLATARQRGGAPRGACALAAAVGALPTAACSSSPTPPARSSPPIRRRALDPRTLSDLLGEAQPLTLFARPRRRHDDPARRRSEALATVRRPARRAGQIAVVQPIGALLADWRSRTLGAGLAACRGGARAHRPRRRLLAAGEPRARGRRGLRQGQAPDRLGAEPRAMRIVGLGHRPRPHLLVGLDVRDARLRAPRTSSCPSARSTPSSIRTTATSTASPTGSPRRRPRSSTTISASAAPSGTGSGCAPGPS